MLVKKRIVLIWMIIGLIMIFLQIIIGGVTRLTGSGLSITKWQIVTGTIPPMDAETWQREFELYKNTPQYKKINAGMDLNSFKFIYYWEYLHRLWARLMGVVFLFPFLYFIKKKWLGSRVVRRLIVVVLLAALVGLFGWIMVASGLIERPWVNAYKLSIHLCLALLLFSYLLWTILTVMFNGKVLESPYKLKSVQLFLLLLCIQIFLGGMMSGLKASLLYPTWPDMAGEWIPGIVTDLDNWNVDNYVDYEKSGFLATLVQILHRSVAYVLILNGLYVFFILRRLLHNVMIRVVLWVFISLLISQVLLGILVLLNSIGSIPVFYGVMHQGVAILLLSATIILYFFQSRKSEVSL